MTRTGSEFCINGTKSNASVASVANPNQVFGLPTTYTTVAQWNCRMDEFSPVVSCSVPFLTPKISACGAAVGKYYD